LGNLPNDGPYLMVPFEVFTWIYEQRRPIDSSMEEPRINTLNRNISILKAKCAMCGLFLYML
jgi:hypothetical protein